MLYGLENKLSISMYCLSSRSITTFKLLDDSPAVQTGEGGEGGGHLDPGTWSPEVGGVKLD